MAQEKNPELARIKGWIAEIQMLEQSHTPAECARYAPGRCPACWRICSLEHEQIEREVLWLDEELGYQLQQQPTAEEIEIAMQRLAEADVWRCHPRGKWPRSIAELEDEPLAGFPRLLPMMVRRRLFAGISIDQYDSEYYDTLAERDEWIETVLVPAYQRFYREACLERWELAQFEHYAPAVSRSS